MISKTGSAVAAALVLSCTVAGAADAGCLTGAVVGGVGGHFVHHPLLGAAGCAVGHHMAVMKRRRDHAAMRGH